MSVVNLGVAPGVVNLIQERTLERLFHDTLFANLLFRVDVVAEAWPAQIGDVQIMTRPGAMQPSLAPLVPGQDPQPASYGSEQWMVQANQYGGSIDTSMPTSNVALAPQFLRNTQQLGMQAGQSLNRIARNKLFVAYNGGNTNMILAASSAATTIRVASLAGFTEQSIDGRLTQINPANPLGISFPGSAELPNTVIGFAADNLQQPFGPGLLYLGAPTTNALSNRQPILAANASKITRVGGANSIDGISAANKLTVQSIINAVASMRTNNVPPHSDGYYHAMIDPTGEGQLYEDVQFQRMYQSLPDNEVYRDFIISVMLGVKFYRNTELPTVLTVSSQVSTGTLSVAAPEIGGEIVNNVGFPISRCIVTGGGVLYEKYIDENAYITEAGVQGKIGEFSVVNGGLQVMTDRIRFILRSPQDRLQQVVTQSWSWTGDFGVPSDQLANGGIGARFRRAVIIEHG